MKEGKLLYTPCSPSDPEGIKIKFMDLNGDQLLLPDVDIDNLYSALSRTKPSVSLADVEKHT